MLSLLEPPPAELGGTGAHAGGSRRKPVGNLKASTRPREEAMGRSARPALMFLNAEGTRARPG